MSVSNIVKIISICLVILGVVFIFLFIKGKSFNQRLGSSIVIIGGNQIFVDIANTGSEKAKGLSGTKSLEENKGMLFDFKASPENVTFWMKDMLIPLDIIWIKDDRIVKIDAHVPPPKVGTPAAELPTYPSNTPIDYVLEVNAGYTEKHNIKVGDEVKIKW